MRLKVVLLSQAGEKLIAWWSQPQWGFKQKCQTVEKERQSGKMLHKAVYSQPLYCIILLYCIVLYCIGRTVSACTLWVWAKRKYHYVNFWLPASYTEHLWILIPSEFHFEMNKVRVNINRLGIVSPCELVNTNLIM